MQIDSELSILTNSSNEEETTLLSSPNTTNNLMKEPVNWINEVQQGNFMPSILLLESGVIKVNDIIIQETNNTLLHLAVYFGLYNVIRTLVETFKANINIQNSFNQTPLHIISNSQEKNIYILSYLLSNKDINVSIRDNAGLTPIFYAVINHFNYAFLSLLHLTHDVNQYESNQNNLLYFAIVNNNRFALDLIINHSNQPGSDSISMLINEKYYNKSSCLSDILITNKNNSITKNLMKYYHEYISIDSIASCKKSKLSFPFYNEFNYELINTLYFYKCGHYLKFIKALLFNLRNDYTTSNYILETRNESNANVCYRYKAYMFYFMVHYFILSNITPYLKLFSFCLFITSVLLITFMIGHINISVLILYGVLLITYAILLKPNHRDIIIDKENYEALLKTIHKTLIDNVLELPLIDDICPICSIRKTNKDINHCHKCKCCIQGYYFHSTLFNLCINKRNVRWYILFLLILMLMLLKVFYLNEYDILHDNKVKLHTKIVMIALRKRSFIMLFIEIMAIVLGISCIGKAMMLILCLGLNVTYHDMFKYHKREIGVIQERNRLFFAIPDVNFVSLCQFIKNLICN